MSTTPAKVATPVKKSTPTTEAIVGAAAINLKKAISEVNSALESATKLADISESLSLQIAEKESKIEELTIEFSEKKRQAIVNLDLEVKAAQDAAATKILESQGKIAVVKVDFEALVTKSAQADALVKSEVAKAEAILSSALKKNYETESRIASSAHQAETAQIKAELTQKDAQIKFLNEQVTLWKGGLDDERKAGVERAKASSVGAINVTSGK